MPVRSLSSAAVYIPAAKVSCASWSAAFLATARAMAIFSGIGIFVASAAIILAPVS